MQRKWIRYSIPLFVKQSKSLNLGLAADRGSQPWLDIPAGTGVGIFWKFTTALLKALFAYQRRLVHPSELAYLACEIEID